MKLVTLEHSAFETPANILSWIEQKGYRIERIKLFEPHDLSSISDWDGLIVMGGPMAVSDEKAYPWLKAEKIFLSKALPSGKPILGICLGAQLIAEALGAEVTRGLHKEMGWFTLEWTKKARALPLFEGLNSPFLAFQWHQDTFGIPTGAVPIAQGNVFANQGFLMGDNILALQFHPEVNFEEVAGWIKAFPDQLNEAIREPYIQRPYQMISAPERFTAAQQQLNQLLDRFFVLRRKTSATSGRGGRR